jgi:menaquinol-cytochrome c reductase iron-sulfur subunit
MPEPKPEARRGFLKVLTGAFGTVMGAIAVVPGLGFLTSPLRRETVTSGDEPLPVGATGNIKPGKPVRVNVIGDRRDAWLRFQRVKLGACWLVRPSEGAPVRAFSTVCPHLGCGIDWNDKTRTFECPCHDSAFDTEGRCLGGPSPRGLDELDVVADAGELKVRYKRFKVGSPNKEPIG